MSIRILVCEDWLIAPVASAPARHWRHHARAGHHHHAGAPPCHHVHLRCHWETVERIGGGSFHAGTILPSLEFPAASPLWVHAAVPEPATWLLLSIAFAAIMVLKRGKATHV